MGADDLHQVPLPREPRADQTHVVVAVVIELDVVREPGEALYQHLGGGGPRPSQVQLVQPRPATLAVEKEVSTWVKLDSIGETVNKSHDCGSLSSSRSIWNQNFG